MTKSANTEEQILTAFLMAYNVDLTVKDYSIFKQIVDVVKNSYNRIDTENKIAKILNNSNLEFSINKTSQVTAFIELVKKNG